MTRMAISMPDQTADWIDAQVAAGQNGSTNEYLRDLVRRDQGARPAGPADRNARHP